MFTPAWDAVPSLPLRRNRRTRTVPTSSTVVFNQGVVTINLVDVACSSDGDFDKFWEILEERLELCHRALRCRHERLLGTVSDVAPILWQYGALARLKKGETIDKLLYDGYSTISLGYAGLHEMCMRMYGKLIQTLRFVRLR